MKKYISLIIPAFNEEKKIKKDIEKAFEYFKQNKVDGEVIISTDGVTDNTNNLVMELMKIYPNLILLSKKNKYGKGEAIKRGVEKARGKYILFADAGYCIPFKFIKNGIKIIEQGYDLALGNRGDKRSKIKVGQPFYRKIGSSVFRFTINFFFGIPHHIKDTQCGFKIYKNNVAKILFKDLETAGMMFDLELILKAKKYKFKIGTFPVTWSNDPETKFNPVIGTLKSIKEIYFIKMKLHL